MNISLVRPPAYSVGLMGAQLVPYLGIAYIGAVARRMGHSVDIIDMCGEDITRTEVVHNKFVAYGMPLSALKTRIKNSDVIGFTCMFSQDWYFHKELIHHVRSLHPKSFLVAGGEHITALPEFCMRDCPDLDACVISEGEEIFLHLLNAIEKGEDLSGVSGIYFRVAENRDIAKTERALRVKEIDALPFPAWDLIPMENYLARGLNYHIARGRTLPMLASRGCPHNCTFCSNSGMWGSKWHAREPKLVVDEMEYNIKTYKAENFVFSDLTAVVNKKKIVDLCTEIINRKINVTWQMPTLRTEIVDHDILSLMFNAGCRDIDFAIESGSKEVLRSVNKKNDPHKMFLLIKDGLKIGMNMSTNIVIGLPDERLKDFLKTFLLVLKLALSGLQEINVFPFIPYPGSKLFNDYNAAKKLVLNDNYFLNLFGYADLSKAISWSPYFGPKMLNFMRLILFMSFYGLMLLSHPRRVIQLIVNIVRGKPTTKLEGVLKRIFKNIRVLRSRRFSIER